METRKYWGEFESLCDNSEDEVDFEDMDAYVDHKPPTQEKLKLYLPYDEECGEVVQVPEACVQMDDNVIHTIKLLQHSRALKELLSNAYAVQNGMGQSGNEETKPVPEPPLFPDGPKKAPKCKVNYPLRYMEKEFSEFSEGEGIPPPVLSPAVTRQVLKKVIATLIAHIGFETTTESVLELLTDICHEYLQKMTKLMRVAADREALVGGTGFPDIMERVFHEMGIGSVCTLHSFYQSRVLMYHARMMHTCRQLDEEYQLIRGALCKEAETKMRENMEEDEDNVPEIHFPAYGDGESDVRMLQPSLETGFQMLQSLEQESQMQGSEQDEEVINVSDSPSINQESNTTAAESVQSASSGQNKSRKRKRKNNT